MALFDEIERSDTRPRKEYEDKYTYLNKSGRPFAEKVRDLLEEWFNLYPYDKKKKLKTNLKNDFVPSFFELFTFVFLKKCFDEVIVEPVIDDLTPDFMITLNNGQKVLVESTIVTETSDEQREHNNRKNVLLDKINEIKSDFFSIFSP